MSCVVLLKIFFAYILISYNLLYNVEHKGEIMEMVTKIDRQNKTPKQLAMKDLYIKLVDEGVITTAKSSLINLVSKGVIPYNLHHDGTKSYSYKKVVRAIEKGGFGKPSKKGIKVGIPDIGDGESEQEFLDNLIRNNPDLTDTNIYKNIYAGKVAKLKYDTESGLLIERKYIEDRAFNIARSIRDKFLTIPERTSNQLATMTEPHEIKEFMYKEIAIVLAQLSDGSVFLGDK